MEWIFWAGLAVLLFLLWALQAAPTISAVLTSNFVITETPNVFGGTGALTIAPMNETVSLNAGTTPAVSAAASFQQALTAGSATVDLTSLPGLETSDTVSFSGLKVQQVKLQNPAANANSITIAQGGSNPYGLLGSTFSITLAPGQSIALNLGGAAPTVGSGAKTLALTGTGSQALNIEMTAG